MQSVSKRESHEFRRILAAMPDERVRYFYLMLGEAIGEQMHQAQGHAGDGSNANTSPTHLADLAARLNTG